VIEALGRGKEHHPCCGDHVKSYGAKQKARHLYVEVERAVEIKARLDVKSLFVGKG